MQSVYNIADNMVTSLGFSTKENIANMKAGISGVRQITNPDISPSPFYGSMIDLEAFDQRFAELGKAENWTVLERLFIFSIKDTLDLSGVKLSDKRSLLIISTTKGNINLLATKQAGKFPKERVRLGKMAEAIGTYFACKNTPLVISNACISGVLGQSIATRLLRSGNYDNIVVTGGDLCTEFTVTGFQALKAISHSPCKPYDKDRKGINLGEGVGTIVLSTDKNAGKLAPIKVLGSASSNDANHISGPSRTGEGLYICIEKALKTSKIKAEQVDFISAHGTATLYNDEMESKAFAHTNLLGTPTNSMKGYFGHTLGAAGTIESIVTMASMRESYLFQSLGFDELGLSHEMNILRKNEQQELKFCLKTASGFGGCNAAIIFEKL